MIDMGCVAPWIARGTLVLMRTCVVNSINTCALVNETRTDPPGMLSSSLNTHLKKLVVGRSLGKLLHRVGLS